MALAKSIVALPIHNGLNTKTDAKQEEPGFLRTAENVVYETVKLLKKRNGYDSLTMNILGGGQLEGVRALVKYGDELCALTDSDFYGFSSSLQKWVRKGQIYQVDQNDGVVIKNAREQLYPSCTIIENLLITSWEEQSGGVKYSVQDLDNNNFLATEVLVDATGSRPIVVAISNTAFVFYVVGAAIRYKKFDILNPSTLSSAVTVVSNLDTSAPLYDVHSTQSRLLIGYNSNDVSDKLAILTIDQNENISSVLNINSSNASSAIDVTSDSNSRVLIAWSSGSDVYYTIYSLALTSALRAPTLVETIDNVKNLSICQTSTDANYRLYYEVRQDLDRDTFIKQADVPLSGSVVLQGVFARSVGLTGTALNINGTIYVPVIHPSELQPTYFLIDQNGVIVTKYFNQQAGTLNEQGVLPRSRLLNETTMLVVASIKNRLAERDEAIYSTLGVGFQTIDLSSQKNFQTENASRNLHIASGVLKFYDGVTVAEHGFHVWPEDLSLDTPIKATVTVQTEGNNGASSEQLIRFSAVPTQGTYTLTLGSETTSPLAFDASNASIKSVLEALPSVTTVTVTGNYTSGINVLFDEPKQSFPVIEVTNSSLVTTAVTISGATVTEGVAAVKEQFELSFSSVPTAGNFNININGNVSGPIAFNATNSQIQQILAQNPSIGAVKEQFRFNFGAVPVSGNWNIVIDSLPTANLAFNASNAAIKSALEALPNVDTATVTGNYSSGITVTIDAPITNVVVTNTVNTLSDGLFGVSITINTLANGNPNVTVAGSFSAGLVVTIDAPAQAFPTPIITANTLTASGNPVTIFPSIVQEGISGVPEVQTISFSQVPVSGNWTITVGVNTTSSLAFNASNAAIKAALEALPTITTCTVTGSYSSGLTVTIDDPIQNFAQFTFPANTLAGAGTVLVTSETITVAVGSPVVNEVQTIVFDSAPQSGTFKIKFGANTSSIINYTANAAFIESQLQSLSGITDVSVTGTIDSGFTITFLNPVNPSNVVEVVQNTLAETSTAFGKMSDGNYAYVATYRWTDNLGQDQVSSPTLSPLTVVLDRGTDNQSIRLKIPTLRLTDKQNVTVDIYRTEDSGTTFYKITNDLSPLFSDPTVDYVFFLDTNADDSIINNEVLYTTGGIIENIAPSSCELITSYNGRIAYVGEEDNRIYYSKISESGFPVEFTDLFYSDVSSVGGPITAIKQMNDKLVVFCEDACFYIAGDPANNANEQSTLTSPEIISTDIGCIDTNSVVLTPAGLMFKSRKGIYLLTTGMGLQYVGARVEAFNDLTITSAAVVGELNQIRFTTSDTIALVYNYEVDRWAVFTNHGAQSSVVIRNDYFYLRNDGSIYEENRQSFSDASSPIKMRIETGWLSLAEIQGFQRVYHAVILGSYRSPHQLNVKVAYDFIEAWTQQETIDVGTFISDTKYGEDSPYGTGSPYGGDGSLYQMRVNLARQKCQSLKLLIEDAQDEVGEGLNLSTITLRAGVKQGTNKLGAERKFGTSGD